MSGDERVVVVHRAVLVAFVVIGANEPAVLSGQRNKVIRGELADPVARLPQLHLRHSQNDAEVVGIIKTLF